MLVVGSDEFDCSQCRNEHEHQWDCRRKGVEGVRGACPVDQQTEESWQWLRQYSYHRREGGPFWYPGPAGEQPARYLRAMERLGHHVGKLESEQREAERAHMGAR